MPICTCRSCSLNTYHVNGVLFRGKEVSSMTRRRHEERDQREPSPEEPVFNDINLIDTPNRLTPEGMI